MANTAALPTFLIVYKESDMEPSKNIMTLTPQTLNQWASEKKTFVLISTLTADHFAKTHLPGARNACVFEVSFLDQVKAITADQQARIVLYGASENSMEATVAAEKLQRAGYSRMHLLEGGMQAWQAAGLPLVGETADTPPAPENRLKLVDGVYRIDPQQSLIEWSGRNPNTKHDGTVGVSTGEIRIENGRPTGTFTIDMNAIQNRSLAGDELQPVLIDHLKSDDFFFTRMFPTATFRIIGGRILDEAHLSAPNMEIKGELTLRGITAGLDFRATAFQGSDRTIIARSQIELDRTRWKIIYGSARFFENLGMHLVFDHISIEVKITASPEKG